MSINKRTASATARKSATNRKTPADATARIQPPAPGQGRSADCDNVALYERGRQLAEQIARRVAEGEGRQVALRRVAADIDIEIGEVRSDVRFQDAVDRIAVSVGEEAREAILAGRRHLSPEMVMRISRTHPDRQRFAMAQVDQGRHPFAKPPAGVDPPYDTLGYGEVRSRIARTAGSLDRVADGLATTPAWDWPGIETLQTIAARIAAAREAGKGVRAEMESYRDRVGITQDRPGRRPARTVTAPAPFRPGRAYTVVSAVRGLMAKNFRDMPRLLSESPPTAQDCAALLAGLGRFDAAAMRLSSVIRGHVRARSNPVPPGRAGRRGRAAAGADMAVRVVDCPDGPADWPGTYILVLHMADDVVVTVRSGRTYSLPKGDHYYVGSAFNDGGGVRTRTGWHLKPVKETPLWRVDFLTPHARAVELWWTFDTTKRECTWSSVLESSPGFGCPAPGFGAADCRDIRKAGFGRPDDQLCKAHLHHSLEPPDVHDFARRLARLVPGHAPVFRQRLGPGERS